MATPSPPAPAAPLAQPEIIEAVEAIELPDPSNGQPEAGEMPNWPDEAAESAFLADARERGEPMRATAAAVEMAEEVPDTKALPTLDDLVGRIPAEVLETLEELFRAKFVRVQRMPKRALKQRE